VENAETVDEETINEVASVDNIGITFVSQLCTDSNNQLPNDVSQTRDNSSHYCHYI